MRLFYLTIFIGATLFSTTTKASFNDLQWKHGVIILKDNSYYRGEIQYNPKKEKIAYMQNEQKITFHAKEVKYFQFYDVSIKNNRAFTSLNVDGDFKIYEIVLAGEIPLYRKAKGHEEKLLVKHYQNTTNYTKSNVVTYDYYVGNGDQLVEIKHFEDDAMPLMRSHVTELGRYIITHKLNLKSLQDQIMIIDHFNEIVKQSSQVVGNY